MSQEDEKRREVIAEIAKRREFVAGLRAAADLIESTPWLPVPFHTTLQAGVGYGLDQAGRFAAVRQIAEQLGVDVVETSTRARVAEVVFPGGITYLVHVNPDETQAGQARRVVPACEDKPATPDLVHAFLPVGIRAPEPRCGAAAGRMALFAYDVTCHACIKLMAEQDQADTDAPTCARCGKPIEPALVGGWWHGGIATDHEAVPIAEQDGGAR
ncbi:MAG TPA: hypothetical protein VGX23_33610 [Actinocrinis sp.]|nr:hypothetical protein [Actinocrinis sp.]